MGHRSRLGAVISVEIAMLGTKGLSVNDPSGKYTLRSLPGSFSGLHLLCLQYVGFKIIDPSVDIGFDVAAEYEEAKRLHGGSPEAQSCKRRSTHAPRTMPSA